MLSIRLRRAGTTKKPHYRVVVADSRAWRDGRFVEIAGPLRPAQNPAVVKIDAERAKYWIGKGARPPRPCAACSRSTGEAPAPRRR